nr:eukaryotic translation initiation factor 4E-1-like [Ipomoea batatas]
MVEEIEKSTKPEELEKSSSSARPSDGGEAGDGPEEGEIVGDSNEMPSPDKGLTVKHPLENSWTFWFDNPSAKSKQTTWGSNIQPIYTFSTVEDFWSVYNNIHHPSKLSVGADFHCFKNKIEPKWEDPVCANGGKWTMTFQKGKSDTCWLYTLLAMIGEQFDHGDEICGAVVNVRARQEKIAVWTKNAANEAAQVSIGKQWKEFLDYKDTIGFIFHVSYLSLIVPKCQGLVSIRCW